MYTIRLIVTNDVSLILYSDKKMDCDHFYIMTIKYN